MPTVHIENLANKAATSADNAKRVLDILHENGIDWMHACGGKGRCTTCAMQVVSGQVLPIERGPMEQRFFDLKKLAANERLACQCQAQDQLTIRVPQRNKLPHLTYTD